MEKTLTISVACYNVGQFLRKTLDSLIAPEIMDELEVLVVNDGSSDDTAEIAREYEEKYPQTFRLVDKANGGYGPPGPFPAYRHGGHRTQRQDRGRPGRCRHAYGQCLGFPVRGKI